MASILLIFLLVKTAASLSGCEICASNGQCNAAFHNGPGKYCGSFYDISTSGNKPCCCPMQATCKVSPTQCMCHVSKRQPSPPSNYYPHPQRHSSWNTTYYDKYQTTGLAPIVAFVVICCCCLACLRRDQHGDHHRHASSPHYVPIATAIPVSCPPAINPAHHSNKLFNYGSTAYDQPSSGGGGGTGAAIASGLGGFAAGAVLSNLIGRNQDAHGSSTPQLGGGYQHGYFFGDSGGGYDIAGDTGGDGYDVSGDSGDGGYDIAGDSGD